MTTQLHLPADLNPLCHPLGPEKHTSGIVLGAAGSLAESDGPEHGALNQAAGDSQKVHIIQTLLQLCGVVQQHKYHGLPIPVDTGGIHGKSLGQSGVRPNPAAVDGLHDLGPLPKIHRLGQTLTDGGGGSLQPGKVVELRGDV